jgi:uncharacterized protein (TIGR02391 family)
MNDILLKFELIARNAYKFSHADYPAQRSTHPFELRNIHQNIPNIVRELFDDGHYSQATFEAFKFIDKTIQKLSGTNESGLKLMMKAFSEISPLISITSNCTPSEKDEQQGYKFIFSGCVLGIRNPRGHEYNLKDSPEQCLDHLCLVSMLLRRLESAGYSLS